MTDYPDIFGMTFDEIEEHRRENTRKWHRLKHLIELAGERVDKDFPDENPDRKTS